MLELITAIIKPHKLDDIDFIPEVKVEVVAAEAAKTDKIGDGKIWAVGLDKLLRVRTGEAGIDAI